VWCFRLFCCKISFSDFFFGLKRKKNYFQIRKFEMRSRRSERTDRFGAAETFFLISRTRLSSFGSEGSFTVSLWTWNQRWLSERRRRRRGWGVCLCPRESTSRTFVLIGGARVGERGTVDVGIADGGGGTGSVGFNFLFKAKRIKRQRERGRRERGRERLIKREGGGDGRRRETVRWRRERKRE